MEGEEQVVNPMPEVDAGTVVDAGKTADKAALDTLEEHKGVEITDNGEKVDTKDKEPTEKKVEEKTPEAEIKEIEDGVKEQQKAEEEVKSDLTSKGVDYDALVKEYEDNGTLSDESMKALKEAGYPEVVVNAFIKGFEAQVNEFTNAVYKMAGGGAKEYGRLCEFVKGLGEADVQAFNETIHSGSLTQLSALINGYKAQMITKYGTSNRSILGGAAMVENKGFNSKDAMIEAMNDPRYGMDMAYTEKVQRMTMQATFLG